MAVVVQEDAKRPGTARQGPGTGRLGERLAGAVAQRVERTTAKLGERLESDNPLGLTETGLSGASAFAGHPRRAPS